MLVNVCPCRWSRVHETCLTNLLKHSTSCGVCKQEIAHDPRAMLSLTQLLCQTYPWAVLIHQLFSLVVAFIALAIILRSYISLKESGVTIPSCIFVIGYAIFNVYFLAQGHYSLDAALFGPCFAPDARGQRRGLRPALEWWWMAHRARSRAITLPDATTNERLQAGSPAV